MLPQTHNHNLYVERDHLKMRFKSVLIQFTELNEDRHSAKSITFIKNKIKIIKNNVMQLGVGYQTMYEGSLIKTSLII